jgi:parallel beta-helix repeat protein
MVKFAVASRTILVPVDFLTIQEAINNATDGDVVFVYNGTYHENVVVNKTVSLAGEDFGITILDGGASDFTVRVDSDNVTVSGFTIRNSSSIVRGSDVWNLNFTGNVLTDGLVGIRLFNANGSYVVGNNVTFCRTGIRLESCGTSLLETNSIADIDDVGILMVNSKNNTVKSSYFVRNVNQGLFLNNSGGNTVEMNSFSENGCGIRLHLSGENFVIDNSVDDSLKEGLLLYYSSGNLIENNDLTRNAFGLKLSYSGNNTLRGNNMALNGYNFDVEAVTLPSFINDVDKSNTVDGKQVYYLVNQRDLVVNSGENAGYLAVVNSTDILVRDLDFSGNGEGVLVAYTKRCTIENASIVDNRVGIYLYDSSQVQVKNSAVTSSFAEGIFIYGCDKSSVEDNIVMFNGVGMYLYSLTNSSLLRNNITSNVGRGVQMLSSNYDFISQNNLSWNGLDGIYVYNSRNNTLSDNDVVRNGRDGMWIDTSEYDTLMHNNVSWNSGNGVYLLTSRNCQVHHNDIVENDFVGLQLSVGADNNTVVGNSISGNVKWGINLYDCSYNRIFGNNFLNRYQAQALFGSSNFWDNGYPQGGNYWSDFGGFDLFWGPYQNLTGSDGINDTPFVINSDNVDHYPLISQSRVHDVAVLNVAVSTDEPYVGWIVDINVTVGNVGDFVESFNVTISVDENVIDDFVITDLPVAESVKLTLSWNTSGLAPSPDYFVKCEASAVSGESNLEDNVWLAGPVHVKMMGDIDGDGRVNIVDIASVAVSFYSKIGDSNYRASRDLNRDGVINIVDITLCAQNFGKSVAP